VAGQYFNTATGRLDVIQAQAVGDHWQLLLHTEDNLPASMAVDVVGDPISWTLSSPALILSEGKGNFTCLHWLNELRQSGKKILTAQVKRVIMHEAQQFPFRPTPSTFLTPDLPGHMIAALPLLDDLGVVSRLCCDEFLPGAFDGSLVDLVHNGNLEQQSWCGFISEQTYDQISPILGEPKNWHNIDCM
jgi:hypothetical protein